MVTAMPLCELHGSSITDKVMGEGRLEAQCTELEAQEVSLDVKR
jgi:hypothetical protein